MMELLMEKATQVRKEWSSVCDSVLHERPKFIKRTRDRLWFSSVETMEEILKGYSFSAVRYIEDDGSITLSLMEIDLIENGKNEQESRMALGEAILEYAMEYYENYALYSHSPNRKQHIPYIFKALIMDDPKRIGESVQCLDGKN
ncbi:hypothetical protein B5F53_06780 [Blautia sp. An249]|uniref:hypothetical protein n=1 Tax=Blautia sp. An249 TaxID=1965603 RepID=UPI000B3A26BE|nr:hypothetical protein [Blautia sp. An249]OUO79653.1 hypothetical protein B5F53_06780 [Blautia sp. An249]